MAEEKKGKEIASKLKEIDFRKDILGRVWFRLDYYDKRLTRLDEDKQKVFLDSYMESARQLNRSLVWIVFFMIIAYIFYALYVLNFAETLAAWIILVYLLFYLARRHRNENEELLRYLLDSEVTPDYAKYTRKK
ncbi:MAG: hypothetical protein JSW41_06015 [Candidatus Aenigmatarchaeota archaeon]|nr:MAG: hypothetical protein JSW41_06015 [Candidatus Aenigmarchaeota archaeon]